MNSFIAAVAIALGLKKYPGVEPKPKDDKKSREEKSRSHTTNYVSLENERPWRTTRTPSFSMDKTRIDGVKRLDVSASGHDSDSEEDE